MSRYNVTVLKIAKEYNSDNKMAKHCICNYRAENGILQFVGMHKLAASI